jgi:hypothetical protein
MEIDWAASGRDNCLHLKSHIMSQRYIITQRMGSFVTPFVQDKNFTCITADSGDYYMTGFHACEMRKKAVERYMVSPWSGTCLVKVKLHTLTATGTEGWEHGPVVHVGRGMEILKIEHVWIAKKHTDENGNYVYRKISARQALEVAVRAHKAHVRGINQKNKQGGN